MLHSDPSSLSVVLSASVPLHSGTNSPESQSSVPLYNPSPSKSNTIRCVMFSRASVLCQTTESLYVIWDELGVKPLCLMTTVNVSAEWACTAPVATREDTKRRHINPVKRFISRPYSGGLHKTNQDLNGTHPWLEIELQRRIPHANKEIERRRARCRQGHCHRSCCLTHHQRDFRCRLHESGRGRRRQRRCPNLAMGRSRCGNRRRKPQPQRPHGPPVANREHAPHRLPQPQLRRQRCTSSRVGQRGRTPVLSRIQERWTNAWRLFRDLH